MPQEHPPEDMQSPSSTSIAEKVSIADSSALYLSTHNNILQPQVTKLISNLNFLTKENHSC